MIHHIVFGAREDTLIIRQRPQTLNKVKHSPAAFAKSVAILPNEFGVELFECLGLLIFATGESHQR